MCDMRHQVIVYRDEKKRNDIASRSGDLKEENETSKVEEDVEKNASGSIIRLRSIGSSRSCQGDRGCFRRAKATCAVLRDRSQ